MLHCNQIMDLSKYKHSPSGEEVCHSKLYNCICLYLSRQGSIVVNLTLSFKVSSLIDKVEFLEDVEEEIEAELENNNIFSDTSVVYYDFDNGEL